MIKNVYLYLKYEFHKPVYTCHFYFGLDRICYPMDWCEKIPLSAISWHSAPACCSFEQCWQDTSLAPTSGMKIFLLGISLVGVPGGHLCPVIQNVESATQCKLKSASSYCSLIENCIVTKWQAGLTTQHALQWVVHNLNKLKNHVNTNPHQLTQGFGTYK